MQYSSHIITSIPLDLYSISVPCMAGYLGTHPDSFMAPMYKSHLAVPVLHYHTRSQSGISRLFRGPFTCGVQCKLAAASSFSLSRRRDDPYFSMSARAQRRHRGTRASGVNPATAMVAAVHGETSHIERLPTELLLLVFAFLDTETLLVSVPGVCRRWRAEYGKTVDVEIDLSFLSERSRLYKRINGYTGRIMLCELVQRFSKVTGFMWMGPALPESTGMAILESLPHVTKFVLGAFGGEHLEDDWYEALGTNCPNLRHLGAPGGYCRYGDYPRLTHLTLGFPCVLSNAMLADLADACPRLESLYCSYWNTLSPECHAPLAQFSHLTTLRLGSWPGSRSTVDDVVLTAIAVACPHLQDIAIRDSAHVTNTGVAVLAQNLPCLQRVDFSGCLEVDNVGVTTLALAMGERLTAISFGGESNSKLCDLALVVLWKYCPNLLEATFRVTNGITSAGLYALARGCRQLQRIAITSEQVMDNGVENIALFCPRLQVADFAYCPLLTDLAVESIAKHCRSVTSLVFAGCPKITDCSVRVVAEHCPQLTTFAFQKCVELTDDGVCALRNCSQLRTVYVSGCPLLTSACAITLSQHCRHLGRKLYNKECGFSEWMFSGLARRVSKERKRTHALAHR